MQNRRSHRQTRNHRAATLTAKTRLAATAVSLKASGDDPDYDQLTEDSKRRVYPTKPPHIMDLSSLDPPSVIQRALDRFLSVLAPQTGTQETPERLAFIASLPPLNSRRNARTYITRVAIGVQQRLLTTQEARTHLYMAQLTIAASPPPTPRPSRATHARSGTIHRLEGSAFDGSNAYKRPQRKKRPVTPPQPPVAVLPKVQATGYEEPQRRTARYVAPEPRLDEWGNPPTPPDTPQLKFGDCQTCGSVTQRAGTCAICPTCGTTSGCG